MYINIGKAHPGLGQINCHSDMAICVSLYKFIFICNNTNLRFCLADISIIYICRYYC